MNKLWEETPPAVVALFEKHHHPSLVYHDLSHTKEVVKYSTEIAAHYKLSGEDRLIIFVAAWFHDTGHLIGPVKGHEAASVSVMTEFIRMYNPGITFVEKISACIMATTIPSHPADLREAIVCDADTWHLGTTAFFSSDEKIRREIELREGKIIGNWDEHTLQFLRQHHFHTEYCRDLLDQGKLANIAAVEKRMTHKATDQNL